ncbi:MAG: molybdopterin-dependent oxidoreductase, partial [Candidatus Thiodiazotropha taylori]|nr:molybdopterin-dependent oxidoreductase [Candidatus Thiodiazotropha taylori]MCW4292385.1 molybdopterin-dependent oxidoreductase [Candidatus Thiodiazotropha taylori]
MIKKQALGKLINSSLNQQRRNFLKASATGFATLAAGGLVKINKAKAQAYQPYPTDNQLETVVTSCAHNCGSRHMLVAHKQNDVIVRLSSDDGRYQRDGCYGKDTDEEPQLRACLRGRAYRERIYCAERLLYPMMRVGERGSGKFKRVSWDEALDFIANKLIEIKAQYGSQAILDQ